MLKSELTLRPAFKTGCLWFIQLFICLLLTALTYLSLPTWLNDALSIQLLVWACHCILLFLLLCELDKNLVRAPMKLFFDSDGNVALNVASHFQAIHAGSRVTSWCIWLVAERRGSIAPLRLLVLKYNLCEADFRHLSRAIVFGRDYLTKPKTMNG